MEYPSSRRYGAALTVFCPLGLGNRLRVLISGLALAEASGRQFNMLWPLTPACAAPFVELFVNPWSVETVEAAAVTHLPYISGWFGHLPDLLDACEPNLIVGHPDWLIRPQQFAGHDELLARCKVLFAELQPTQSIQQAADTFRQQYFQPTMIGVHLRRGDLLRERPDSASNTAQAVAAVDHFLDESPGAGIFLCTDDGAVDPNTGRPTRMEGVQGVFRRRYGSRVVWAKPHSLDRRTRAAIQDALVDLWLLRATDCFVGTQTSSFSELVLFARDMPHLLVAGATPGYRRIERLARMIGLYAILLRIGKQQTAISLPFPVLLRSYRTAPYRWAYRVVRRVVGCD